MGPWFKVSSEKTISKCKVDQPWNGTYNLEFFSRALYQLSYHFPTHTRLLTTLKKKLLEKIVGKGENSGNKHFLPFPQCFLIFPKQPEFFMEFKSLKYSESASPEDHFCVVSLKYVGQFQRRRCLYN